MLVEKRYFLETFVEKSKQMNVTATAHIKRRKHTEVKILNVHLKKKIL